MNVLLGLLKPMQVLLDSVLAVGRGIAIFAIGMMVVAILIQVFFRYVLNNALPWPDEAARFCMLWMTGFMAPAAFRVGGFVAIDMVILALPKKLGALLSLALLFISLLVLVIAVQIGWNEVTGFGGRFATASLYVPFDVIGACDALGLKPSPDSVWCRLPRSWMMASLLVGVFLLVLVNIELILRSIVALGGAEDQLRPMPGADDMAGAE